MARKRKNDLDDWNRSLGYSKESLDALSSGNYDQWSGDRNSKYRTSQEQTVQSKELPTLKGLSAPKSEWSSRLSNARQYQQNLEADANNYKFNNATRKANTLDADDMKFLQKYFDEYGDSARTKKALYESNRTKGWEQKYGKSYDEIYKDFLADQGNVNLEKGFTNPIKSEIETAFGVLPQIGASAASFIGNMINPDSKFAKGAEELRHENEVVRKQKREGVKASGKAKVDTVNKIIGQPESLKGVTEKAKSIISSGADTAHGLSDRMLPTALAKATKVPFLDAVASGLSDYNTQMEEVRLRPGMDGRDQAKAAGAHAAVEGLGTAITMGLLDKIPGASGMLGKAINIAKGAGNGAAENYISEFLEQKLDNVVSGDLSEEKLNEGIYMLNGMSPEQAAKQVAEDKKKQRLTALGTGALFGGGMKAIGEAANAVKSLPTLKGVPLDVSKVDTSDIDNVIDNAVKQADEAQANIKNLTDQIPETKTETSTNGLKPLEGMELENAQKEIDAIDSQINALRGDIEQYSKIKNNKGNTTKAAKAKIKEAEAKIDELEASKIPINRKINGEATPILEQIEKGSANSIKYFKNDIKNVGALTEEGAAIAKEANKLLDSYVETGDPDIFREFGKKVFELHAVSRSTPKYFKDWGNTENGIWDQLSDGSPLMKALHKIDDVRAKSAPTENPIDNVPPQRPPMPPEDINGGGRPPIPPRNGDIDEGNIPPSGGDVPPNNGGNVPPNPPKPPTTGLEEGKNLSRRYETLMNSDLIKSSRARMQMVENAKQAGVFDKGIEKRVKAQQAALQEYLADEQGAINDLASRQWDSGKDVDMSMLILQDALDSNNQSWANMTLLKQAVETKAAGRELRALRDYSYGNTREGTLAKAADYLVDKAEAHLKSNKTNAKLTAAAEKIAKGDFDALKKSGMDDENIQNIIDAVNNGADAERVKLMLAMYESVGSTGISKEAMSKLNGLYARMSVTGATSKARDDIMQDVFKVLADDIGGKRTWREMWDSWRYLAMLGNPKTHLRNMLGNTTHRMVTETKDNIAAVMEGTLDKASRAAGGKGIQRTKALLGAGDRNLIDMAAKDADDVAYASLNDMGNKYNVKNEIDRARNSFNSKWLSNIDELNSKALDLEDYSALKKKYSRSLARFLKANGADESIFDATDDASKALLQKGRDYAVDQAKQATFHEYSKMAELLTRMSTDLRSDNKLSHKLGGAVLEGLLPFKKTPINILKQGIKYSPISLAKAVGKMYDSVKTGNSTASDAIEDLASGLTGTGIMALGAFLKHQGLLTGAANENYNVDTAETEQGAQNYALKIGDKSYTLDWLAPMSLPLFVGAELMDLAGDQDGEGDTIDRVIGAISTIAEPVTEMSMLQGIQNILNELSYSRENLIATFGANTALGYLSQGLPTLGGQIARAIDDTRRATYTDQPAGFRRQFDKALTKDLNKIPVLSMGNQPYIDSSGQTQQNEGLFTSMLGNNFGTRLMDQMLSPGYYKEGNVTDIDRELNRLYEATGTDVYKDVASGKTEGGEKLSKEAFTKYQELYGGNNDILYKALINSDEYNGLDDTEKVKMISEIKSFSKLIADHEIGGKALTDSNQKKYDIYKSGGIDGVIKYFKDSAKAKSLGLTYDNYTKQEAKNPGGAAQYVSEVEEARKYGFLKKDGTLNMQQYYNALDYAGSDPQSIQAYANYRSQGFENNTERIPYLMDDQSFTNEQKGRIIGGLNPDKFKKNPKAMYDMGGYEGLWNYYMLKYLADTDGNGRVSKAESDALLNSDNPYVTVLPDDQYYFLAKALYK